MYSVSCKDLGADCDFRVSGETIEETKNKMFAHAKEDHGDQIANMSEAEMAGMDKKLEDFLAAQS